jgi:hypothetical protein
MGLHSYANTRDGNEKAIVDALLQIGASVFRLDKPCDLLVGYRGINFLLEVKLPLGPRGGSSHSDLNDWQKDFDQSWTGQFEVVRSALEAVELVTSPRLSSANSPSNLLH